MALRVVRENKRYYRICVAKKTLFEAQLGLTTPFPGYESFQVASRSWGALATQEKVKEILENPDGYAGRQLRGGSVSGAVEWTLLGFVLFNLVVALSIANALAACPIGIPCAPIP